MEKKPYAGTRLPHLDILRVLSILTVIFLHGSTKGPLLFLQTENTAEYWISLFLSALIRFAVPVFFMISGALLLGKEEGIRTVYRKRVLRMSIVFLLVSAVYYAALHFREGLQLADIGAFFRAIYTEPITAPLWYMYAYIAALILLPFLRKLAKLMQPKDYLYLLLLRLVFVTGIAVADNFIFRAPLTAEFQIPIAVERGSFYMLMGYCVEHKLPTEKFTKKNLGLLWIAALFFVSLCAVLTHLLCLRDGYTPDTLVLYDKFTALSAIAVYASVKALTLRRPLSEKTGKLFTLLAENVFGIYLAEKALREILTPVYTHLQPVLTALPAAFVWTFCCFVCGEVLIFLIRRIPLARKLLG